MRLPSYVHGVSEFPLLGLTVHQLLDNAVEKWPEGDALIVPYQSVRWTYSALAEKVESFAAGLIGLGLARGDRLGIWAPNCAEWIVAQYAAARAGLILVNINPAYRLPELRFALAQTGCRALIFSPALKSSDYLQMLHQLLPQLAKSTVGEVIDPTLPMLRWLIAIDRDRHDGILRFEDIPALARARHRETLKAEASLLQFDDPVNIQFTSGTTGIPKAATLTHHNIVNNAYFVAGRMRLGSADKLCIPVPMYHCFGMVLGSLCCVASGAAMVFASAGFDAHACLETLSAERCTAVHGVPTMFISMLEDADFAAMDLGALRTGIMAGAPCPVELMKRVINEMHLDEITIAYGMTETGPVSFQTSTDDSIERRVDTVGPVLPHIEIKIVDRQKRIVPRGERGELLTRGYCVMPGYWRDDERTADAIDSARWIASGDIAVIDESGYCRIAGRIKDMLIRGGENIYPAEIEQVLYRHPKIDEVEVFGVPDEKYGEEACAWIKLRRGQIASSEEIRQFCDGRIAHFKIPRYIRFVESYPMTATGKVKKYLMREQMAVELGESRSSGLKSGAS